MSGLLLFVSDVSPYRSPSGEVTVAGVHHSLGSAARAFEEISLLYGLEFRGVTRVSDATEELLGQTRVLVLHYWRNAVELGAASHHRRSSRERA
jgi:hypothetical protein